MANTDLNNANKAKKDEFYTQLEDIEKEMKNYKEFFKGKVVFCNCDDPYESNFFKYFAMNFNHLGLKKLIATCYVKSTIAGKQLTLDDVLSGRKKQPSEEEKKRPYKLEINEVADLDGDGAVGLSDVELLIKNSENTLSFLEGDGDFRSQESINILKQSDVVVTNPPFSLFREFVLQLFEYQKSFIILGNMNAITYKEIFPLIKDNKMWLGQSIHSGDREFRVPDDYPLNSATHRTDEQGNKYIRVKGVRWYTNVDYSERHEELVLYKKYTPEEYPKYDNYNAIDVGATSDIPADYNGLMGVPKSFIDKYNPDQFEIMGQGSGREEFDKEAWPTIKYENPIQHNKDGSTSNGSKLNTAAVFRYNEVPKDCIYYTADNAEGYLVIPYARIFIRRRSGEWKLS
ncbi:MAG: modification methylase [Thermoplasmata archaeon]|nr:modification methylase [Thermoplasmata archaeon]